MNKMVINHLEKLFITNDSATIVAELEVQHPAAKLLVMASKMLEAEVGDGTNFVVVFAGAATAGSLGAKKRSKRRKSPALRDRACPCASHVAARACRQMR